MNINKKSPIPFRRFFIAEYYIKSTDKKLNKSLLIYILLKKKYIHGIKITGIILKKAV